jgi:histidyl-tRNA synthetase
VLSCAALAGVEAEAELLAAITTFFSRVGITSADVGIKVSSRKVLAAVLDRYQVPRENFAQVGLTAQGLGLCSWFGGCGS